MLAFEHFGGTPHKILHDRFKPRACKAYRAKTKGKIERPFRYVRANFALARSGRVRMREPVEFVVPTQTSSSPNRNCHAGAGTATSSVQECIGARSTSRSTSLRQAE
jgi:transposase